VKLLIVEDDTAIRESLVDFFVGRGARVDAVASSEAADAVLDGHDAVLLDLTLPGRQGLDWLADLRRRGDPTPVLIMTARGEEDQRIAGLRAGADDYCVKPFSVRELEARVDAVLRRAGPGVGAGAGTPVRIGAALVDLAGHEVRVGDTCHRLLQKEAELLACFLAHPGETMQRSRLLHEVWGYDTFPTTRTVDTHVLNLRKKIEATPDRPAHLLTVHRVGYRLVL
jgi:two-component system alkaline phosphatase synthesis response regulator PhoP